MLESLQGEQQNNISLNKEDFFRQERDSNDSEVENSELVDRAIEDDLAVYNLLDKKYFFGELKKIKQQFFNDSITREEYKYKKRNLYTKRAIQKSVQVFSSAEQFLLDDRDISSEDLAEKIKQYASENNLTLSVDQGWMIDRASKMLDERRQVVVDLLDEAKKILPEGIDVPQLLVEWDDVINESLELKLFILNKSEYLLASSAKNEAIKEMTRATKNMTTVMEEFLATDGAYNHELYIEYRNRLEVLRQMELAMYNNELKAFRLSEIHKDIVPSAVRDYFENILHNIKVSFDEKPLALVVTVFSESLWRDIRLKLQ